MTKIKLLSVAVIGLLIINIAIVGFLVLMKPPHLSEGRPPLEKGGPKQLIIESLDFNTEQTAAYDKLITAHQVSIRTMEDSIGLLKNKLYQTLNDESSSDKDIIVNHLGEIQKEIELINYKHFVALKKLCTPDQLNKFNKLTTELAHFFAIKKGTPPPPKD